ncbi:MAG: hypothetical protein HUJ55_08155 [Ileibacterium sp.]|nr:hypothetical protein [Ileibacterium sp.]
MEKKISIANRQVILNYNKAYPKNREALLKSSTFRKFIEYFIRVEKDLDHAVYMYLTCDEKYSIEEAAQKFCTFLRLLAVFEYQELAESADYGTEYTRDRNALGNVIEEIYRGWRSLQRFGFMNSLNTPEFGINTLVARDSDMNDLILRTYRLFEEKIQGRMNRVYRQVQAGTNACFSVHMPKEGFNKDYAGLKDIPVIDCVMLRTPMILHPKSSKRTGMFTKSEINPMEYLAVDPNEWFCLPLKVGKLLCYVYFNTKYTASALSMANLFELADMDESEKRPDLLMIFGNEDGKNETVYYHDEKNGIWVGCISDDPRVEYFGYLKKMALTLHNLAMMEKGWLPIHGAMVNIVLKDGRKKGIVLMGDSGAGKSESIEALKHVGKDLIKSVEVVFDDMGTIHMENGVPYGQGTEIGAFIRLDDLDPGTPYRDMDRSVFFAPENPNSRMVVPAATYEFITENHPIDLFCYANNYTDAIGMKELPVEEVKETCKAGTRMALGTTQEVGLSKTYFANPFGPMQEQELCEPLIDTVFEAMKNDGVYMGEIYTHLGFDKSNRQGIEDAAKELLNFITKEE